MSFEIFLRIYNGDDNYYMQDLKHLRFFGCKIRVHILEKMQIESYKYMEKMRKGILVGYKNIKIFQINFLL